MRGGGGFSERTVWLSGVSVVSPTTRDEWNYGPFTGDAFVMIRTEISRPWMGDSGRIFVEVNGALVAKQLYEVSGSLYPEVWGTGNKTWTIPVQAGDMMRIEVLMSYRSATTMTATIHADIYYLQ